MSDYLRPITRENPYRLCFVCLGNICRSPTAEGIFIHKVNGRGLQPYFFIDSAGTAAYHTGEGANSKSQSVANERGVHLPSIARPFAASDLEEFDLVLAMDAENLTDLVSMDRERRWGAKLVRMRQFDPEPEDGNVPDPYYGGMHGFRRVFDILDRSCERLLDVLEPRITRDM